MGPKFIFAAFVVAIAAILAYFMTYVVEEGQQAVITQFGKPVNFVTEPGLKFRMPFIQSVHKLEKRLLPWDGDPENMQTGDKKRIYVDCWARWRIVDLETFFTNVQTEQQGHKILDDIVDSSVRDVIARNNLIDLVRTSKDRELVQETDRVTRTNVSRDVVTTGRRQIERIFWPMRATVSSRATGCNWLPFTSSALVTTIGLRTPYSNVCDPSVSLSPSFSNPRPGRKAIKFPD